MINSLTQKISNGVPLPNNNYEMHSKLAMETSIPVKFHTEILPECMHAEIFSNALRKFGSIIILKRSEKNGSISQKFVLECVM